MNCLPKKIKYYSSFAIFHVQLNPLPLCAICQFTSPKISQFLLKFPNLTLLNLFIGIAFRPIFKFLCMIFDWMESTRRIIHTTRVHVILFTQNSQYKTMQRQVVSLNDFSMLSMIGIGNYAKVILVRRKTSGRIYAMKIVKKRREEEYSRGLRKCHAYIEKEVLTQAAHPFVIKLYSTFQRHRKLYYILQYCPGGELFGLVRRHKRLNEAAARFYAAQILLALEHLHTLGFIYRDLKPQNVLIDAKGYVKIVDFGLSCHYQSLSKTQPIAGTPQYLPPEVFRKGGVNLGRFTDWWAFGNLLFQMVAGFPPFFQQNQRFQRTKARICQEEPPLYFITNPILRDLLQGLLKKDPEERLGTKGAQEIKQHNWFFGTNWQGLLQEQLPAPFTPQIKNDADTHWFQLCEGTMTPPQQELDRSSGEKYHEFTLSWKGSSRQSNSHCNVSPEEITINIQENSSK